MHAFLLFRMTNLSGVDLDGTNDGGRTEPGRIKETSLPGLAKKTTRLQLPGLGSGSARSSSRSLFIFSEETLIGKYAKSSLNGGILCSSVQPYAGLILEHVQSGYDLPGGW